MIKKGEILDLTVESLAFGGKGEAKFDDLVIFVNYDMAPLRSIIVGIVDHVHLS